MSISELITSRENSSLKLARRVRDGKEDKLIFVEGVRLAEEALRSGVRIRDAFFSEQSLEDKRIGILLSQFEDAKIVSQKAFDSLVDTETPQGVVLIGERPDHSIEHLNHMVIRHIAVYLDRINNPLNLGAVIRTAEAAGVDLVMTSPDSADAFSPKSIRASMGSCFRLPIFKGVDFEKMVRWAGENGLRTTATDLRYSSNYTDSDWKKNRILILGSEAHGLQDKELEMVDERVRISMENGVESLNLAVSAGIILFEAKRQRDTPIE